MELARDSRGTLLTGGCESRRTKDFDDRSSFVLDAGAPIGDSEDNSNGFEGDARAQGGVQRAVSVCDQRWSYSCPSLSGA